jgi:hypothetical protein
MKTGTSGMLKILLITSILLNIFDIVLHVAIGQPEALRIIGNTLIIMGSAIALLRWHPKSMLVIGLTSYLVLNFVFIAFNSIGTVGVAFISLTSLLTLLTVRHRRGWKETNQ